jgi:hypothetical protein
VRTPLVHAASPDLVTRTRYHQNMTIAAGFVVEDGILLCADTQYAGGTKIHKAKLFPGTFGGSLSVIFALAGNDGYGRMAIEDTRLAIASIPEAECSVGRIAVAVREAVKIIDEEYVSKRPPNEIEGSRFELLMAVWHQMEGLHLFAIRHTFLEPVDSHECIGIGEYLARYLIGAYRKGTSKKQAAITAARMLSALKDYDANCGGFSQIVVLRSDGTFSPNTWYESKVEDIHIPEFERLTRDLLSRVADVEMDDAEFKQHLDSFSRQISGVRESWRKESGKWALASMFAEAREHEE